MPFRITGLLTLVLAVATASAAEPAKPRSEPTKIEPAKPDPARPEPSKVEPARPTAPKVEPARPDDKMPITGLAPSKIIPDLCLLRYRVTTASPACQAHFDQGLGWFYSYVWMEAARSFETASRLDPECAMAWLGLSRALEKWGRGKPDDVMKKAQELSAKASPTEKMLITARMQERGLTNVPTGPTGTAQAEARRRAAAKTLDELLTLYDDDEEAWYYRAQIAGRQASIPYYRALLRINPLHPGANHELVHFFESNRRPALGWINAENYVRSSPGIPHAFHMQAHLATRLGRWEKTSDRSARAIELQRAYHQTLNVSPGDDHQFTHHLEIGTASLVHDGRFREARVLKEEARKSKINQWGPWFRLHLAERDWDEAQKCVEQIRRIEKARASYYAALLFWKKGDMERARPEIEVLLQSQATKKNDRALEIQVWETQGAMLCRQGAGDAGLQLLAKAVARTKDDYSHHAWGNGAYYMETWGIEALRCNKLDVAEEAFLEALAHDPGSVRAALGLQVLCERLNRTEEASRYSDLARRCWKRAEIQTFDTELAEMRLAGAPSRLTTK